ncbi:group II intron reverse transcriptase/maturase [bacterium]|nr:group II intron reverse transcriptase/maturase [bacterium]
MQEQPNRVPQATQDGDIRDDWSWVEASVWTDRMLATLVNGVKGGKWYSLWDKVWRMETLLQAFHQVASNNGSPGVDHQTIAMFDKNLHMNLANLSQSLREGTYRPQSVKRVWIDKPGSKQKRPLGIPTVRDRIVQTALRMVIEPIYEHDFSDRSYGFRPGRGCKDALREVQRLLDDGYVWVLDADLKSYFDTIDQDRLLELVGAKVTDGGILQLLQDYLNQTVMDGLEEWQPESGTPQGAVISPLLANIFLNPLDHLMDDQGFAMIRYADDFVILCRSEDEAQDAHRRIASWTTAVGLILHPEKTHIVDARQKGGFDFLGYHFESGKRVPSKKSMRKFKDTIRQKTKRTNGHSMEFIIYDVNRTVRGWFEYFKHSRWWTFDTLDKWIRMRLRSILRRRLGKRGRGRGIDHIMWRNSFFVNLGLFSMFTARKLACQSAKR